MPTMIIVGRYWDNPQIFAKVNVEGIAIGMDVDDFIKAVQDEMGMGKVSMGSAAHVVLEKMKEESARVISTVGNK